MRKVLALVGAVRPHRPLLSATRWILNSGFSLGGMGRQLIDLADQCMVRSNSKPAEGSRGAWPGGVRSVFNSDALIIACSVSDAEVPEGLGNLLYHLPVEAVATKAVGIVMMGGRHQYALAVDRQLRNVLVQRGALIVPASVRLTPADFETGLLAEDARQSLSNLADSVIKLMQVAPRPEAERRL
jgi:NAD(P)H-dependent FMN reductase